MELKQGPFPYFIAALWDPSTQRPDLKPLHGTIPLTPVAAVLPPLIYYLALLLLPPFPGQKHNDIIAVARSLLALTAGFLFFRLPLAFYVPFSIGLTYQLALVGLYGGCRVLDAFFISPYLFNHIPRRVKYHQAPRDESPNEVHTRSRSNSYFSLHFLQPKHAPVTETATTESGWPHSWSDRASWAIELELSMRGAGFTWSSADVRHTKKTWSPSVKDRVYSIFLYVLPVLSGSWIIIRYIYMSYLHPDTPSTSSFDELPWHIQFSLTAALGGFLMSAFSLGHSMFAVLLAPLAPHPLSYFPPLYTLRIWELSSVRDFWSYGWHRLFSRLFLVYGVWPGEFIERKLTGKTSDQPGDVGKVFGGFISSAFVHSFAAYTVVGGVSADALGEMKFFAGCGLAVVAEEIVKRTILVKRRQQKQLRMDEGSNDLKRWYDGVVGRVWWVCVLLYTGRNFARGWVGAGLVREVSGL